MIERARAALTTMFAENPKVNAELLAIVRRATSDAQLHEDFCQEALLHLLRTRRW